MAKATKPVLEHGNAKCTVHVTGGTLMTREQRLWLAEWLRAVANTVEHNHPKLQGRQRYAYHQPQGVR